MHIEDIRELLIYLNGEIIKDSEDNISVIIDENMFEFTFNEGKLVDMTFGLTVDFPYVDEFFYDGEFLNVAYNNFIIAKIPLSILK